MVIILLGPPGSGKGTSANLVCKKYNLFSVSTGDLLRHRAKGDDDLAKQITQLITTGHLIPDQIIDDIVKEVVSSESIKTEYEGLLFDGYPRTVQQAISLDAVFQKNALNINAVLLFNIAEDVIVQRLSSRRIDRNTGAIYNLISNPPPSDANLDLYQRHDDQEKIILHRIEVYKKQTEPLINFYNEKNILFNISSEQPVEAMQESIYAVLSKV